VKQSSTKKQDHWEYSFWLIFDDSGRVRLQRGVPSLNRNERAISMKCALPLSLWSVPQLSATLTVLPDGKGAPVAIDVAATATAIKMATGLDFDISVLAS
jgi:hypothetical protein